MKEYLASLGIIHSTTVHYQLPVSKLVEKALLRGEGTLSETGALVVTTGKYTGRSPEDRFIVDEASIHNEIDWGKVNKPVSVDMFNGVYNRMMSYLQNRELFVFDGFAGADEEYRVSIRIINELASQNLFMHQLLLRPTEQELASFAPGFTIVAAPGFKCIPAVDGTISEAAIIVSFEKKMVIIAGSQYAGEIKKSVFSVLNYLLPKQGVFPMHCSANIGADDDVAVFFGLSGTGKTTLSADPNRKLIGDDEHGWSKKGVFNFEGGCYAKCINLKQENEPQVWNAIKFGALVENVVMDPQTREFDFDDGSLTENTRVGYPVEFIPNAVIPGVGDIPKTVIFLTADAFGVLPPISKLDKNQAMYHFVSGYTARLAGTERGVLTPDTTFSTCFGAPFLPLNPSVYAEMLGKAVDSSNANVYLVNTGWSGGPYGVGKRMAIKLTRALITAALNGDLSKVEYFHDPVLNVDIPKTCPNVPSEVLNPRDTWADKAAYDASVQDVANRFVKNFAKYKNMPEHIIKAGPVGK